jgi:hypothetical protein
MAVIQPTLFEGGPGGGAAYDAVAAGVPVLLSDIPINQEISDPRCRFFPKQDDSALASLMLQLTASMPSRIPTAILAEESAARMASLGAVLIGAIELAIQKYPRQDQI